MSALDVGTFVTLDLGHDSAVVRAVVGAFAAFTLGLMVVTMVSRALGSFSDCPAPEGPSFSKGIVCIVCSEVT